MEIWKNPKNIVFWLLIIIIIISVLLFYIQLLIKISYKKSVEKKQALFNAELEYANNLKIAIIEVQDQERKHIASELHDQVSNKLNLLILKLNNLPQANEESILHVKSELKNIISKNRDISHYLFPVEIENIGLLFTLQDLSIKYNTPNFNIALHYNEIIYFECKQIELQLYRVIQESLTNVLKHSQATTFSIHLRKSSNGINVLIADNGVGFSINTVKKGLGFSSIETRLNSINAKYKLKSTPDQGSSLIIQL